MNITICGGGNLGHVTAGFWASQGEHNVSILTTRPEKWSHYIEVFDNSGNTFKGKLKKISSLPKDVIPNADIVLLCIPGYAIHDLLISIVPYLDSKTFLGSIVSSTGFFFEAFKIVSNIQPLFGFQRVPFISRIINYGHVAELKGYKESLCVAVEQTDDKESVRKVLEMLFKTPTHLAESYYEVSLSNSNPLLHTSRLYTMWKNWEPGIAYDSNPDFYTEWTKEASQLLISMDEEFQKLLMIVGLREGAIPSVLSYYESYDADSLTKKIQSISAFKGISSPMSLNKYGRYEPDFSSRYFVEDFPYGMRFIVETAQQYNVATPIIDEVYQWGIGKCDFYDMQNGYGK